MKLFLALFTVLVFHLLYGQNSADPEFKGESKMIQVMLSDSLTLFADDTLTIGLGFYTNGSLKEKLVYYHPEGAPDESWKYGYLNFATSSYHENGEIAAYRESWNGRLHGDYLQFDSDNFVTHWVFDNDKLVDVKNDNCRFLNQKGRIITKEEFFECFESPEFGQWGYYLLESEHEPYNQLICVDYVMYSDKWPISDLSEGEDAARLIKCLNKTCKE